MDMQFKHDKETRVCMARKVPAKLCYFFRFLAGFVPSSSLLGMVVVLNFEERRTLEEEGDASSIDFVCLSCVSCVVCE